eukprot:TRINITY_DN52705_c0_g1_i1.p1 TRINITY_DN52705_c0_g1~~TRINITY_DN52705_c0_g1_i1.p1  ORF type:complete len:526 (-),score=105.59 TRINITY_DN52705_c0_g1_i1:34-1611(-)
MAEDDGSCWQDLWSDVLNAFKSESGDAPSQGALEDWEQELLQKLLAKEVGDRSWRRWKRSSPLGFGGRAKPNERLEACEQRWRRAVTKAWDLDAAEDAASQAAAFEREGRWELARESYAKAMSIGTSLPVDTAMRFAQLLHVMAACAEGDATACEFVLRHALELAESKPKPKGKSKASTSPAPVSVAKRAVLGRLVQLLVQEGREEEAKPLLHQAGWQYRLAPWVFRYPWPEESSTDAAGFPGRVFDNALPVPLLQHLRELLAPGSLFWREHGYNEVAGCGENGYFSYLHPLDGPSKSTMDVAARYIRELLQKENCFPGLAEATAAEWWAHCRPHACGHQMHFDSDNEGIGGARHPICSCVVYVEAPPGVGGPTLVTDQRLSDPTLATKGWLVYPKPGRLASYDGTYLHGVVPGHGKSPSTSSQQRRITWMVAFWHQIETRPFGADGLAGSSRPLPDPAAPLTAGPKTYTWHQELRLPKPDLLQREDTPPVPASLPLRTGVWTTIDGCEVGNGEPVPAIDKCYQF